MLEGTANRFFRRLREGVFDEDDLRARTDELADFVRAAGAEHGLAPGSLYAVGFSNGANTAAALLLLHPELLAGAVLVASVPPFTEPPAADLTGRRVLISNGERDPMARPEQTAAARRAAARARRGCRAAHPPGWAPARAGAPARDAARSSRPDPAVRAATCRVPAGTPATPPRALPCPDLIAPDRLCACSTRSPAPPASQPIRPSLPPGRLCASTAGDSSPAVTAHSRSRRGARHRAGGAGGRRDRRRRPGENAALIGWSTASAADRPLSPRTARPVRSGKPRRAADARGRRPPPGERLVGQVEPGDHVVRPARDRRLGDRGKPGDERASSSARPGSACRSSRACGRRGHPRRVTLVRCVRVAAGATPPMALNPPST